ncbi:MAG: hypothetical protein ACTSWH_05985, partial [Promethearchaeota archaeon]
MSDEYEKDDEEEYKPPKPPSMPPPSNPSPTSPLTPPPPTPAAPPVYQTEPVSPINDPVSTFQYEYESAISQVQQKENAIYQLKEQMKDVNAQFANLNAQLLEKENYINQLS